MLKSDKLLRLDARQIMNALPEGKSGRTFFTCQFEIKDGCIHFCKGGRLESGAGKFVLSILSPNVDEDSVIGTVTLRHPSWQTFPRMVLLTGQFNLGHAPTFRLLCPITRNLVRVLYFDETSHLFVASDAIGRRQRRSDLNYIKTQLQARLKLEDRQSKLELKYPDLNKMPVNTKKRIYEPLIIALEALEENVLLASNSIRPDREGGIDISDLLRKAPPKSKTYVRDRSGIVKLTASAKKRLGFR